MFDVLCVGNANVDAFLSIHDENAHCHLDENKKELCITSGEKILVDDCQFLLGGGASNVAVGISRSNHKAALIAGIGDDEFAAKIRKVLTEERVDTTHIVQTKGASSSFSIGINFKNERTLFVRHVKREHNFSLEGFQAQWIYLGGLGKEWENAYKNATNFVKNNRSKLAFAPGTTQIQAGFELLSEVLRNSTILFLNKEEAQAITSKQTDSIDILLKSLAESGVEMVVITDGKNGAYGSDGSKMYHIPCFSNESVEKTGAGDGFASGFLIGILEGKDFSQSLCFGAVNAHSVVQYVGAQKGLLTKEEIEKKLSENPEFQVKEL